LLQPRDFMSNFWGPLHPQFHLRFGILQKVMFSQDVCFLAYLQCYLWRRLELVWK